VRVQVEGLTVSYHAQTTQVLHHIDLAVEEGTCTAIVGESGSGKTTLGRAIAGRLPLGATTGGVINCDGTTVYMVQDAASALNPLRRVKWQLRQALRVHGTTRRKLETRMQELLLAAGISDPPALLRRYPHELSGGLAQRVLLATVLAIEPEILIVDEPTSALDVTTQAKVMALFRKIVEVDGRTVVLITHDFVAASMIADQVAVMYQGKIVERGLMTRVIEAPQHEYTRALVRAATSTELPVSALATWDGDVRATS
jgi:peptide/nickel transport system ATP-binding protein